MDEAPDGFIVLPGAELATGTAVVFEVVDSRGTVGVCKRLGARARDEAWMRERLEGEGRLLAALDGRGTSRLVAAGTDARGPWIVVERVSWPTLEARRGVVDARWIENAAALAFGALACVHEQGVTHGDVSTTNVLVAEDDEGAFLIDFGLARGGGMPPLPMGPFRGTLRTAAPEVARGDEPGTPADVFSLAVSLLATASGQWPRTEGNAAAMLTAAAERSIEPWASHTAAPLDASLARLLIACCAFEPQGRPPAVALARR